MIDMDIPAPSSGLTVELSERTVVGGVLRDFLSFSLDILTFALCAEETNSLQLSCEEGYALSCLFSASYGSMSLDAQCVDWETSEEVEESSILPQSVWNEDCVGQRECTLEMGHVGHSDYVCSDVSAVENTYFSSVNGVEMERVGSSELEGYKAECQFVAMKVQALCSKEISE